MFTKIERSVFFPAVRGIAFIGAVILLLLMVGGIIFIVTFDARKIVNTISEVQKIIKPEERKQTIMARIKLPENVERYLTDNAYDKQNLEEWLAELKTDKERKTFLAGLSQIITDAEKNDPGKVYNYINTFRAITNKQSELEEMLGINFSDIVEGVVRTVTIGATVFGILFLFVIFSLLVLLLLLLSIERNTRRES